MRQNKSFALPPQPLLIALFMALQAGLCWSAGFGGAPQSAQLDLRCRSHDNGYGIGATVEVSPLATPPAAGRLAGPQTSGEPVMVTADESGRIALEMASGDYRVTVEAAGFHALSATLSLEAGVNAVTFWLDRLPIPGVDGASTPGLVPEKGLGSDPAGSTIVTGYVIDPGTGRPIPDVDVSLAADGARDTTDSEGFFRILTAAAPTPEGGEDPPTDSLIFEARGFLTQEITGIELFAGETRRIVDLAFGSGADKRGAYQRLLLDPEPFSPADSKLRRPEGKAQVPPEGLLLADPPDSIRVGVMAGGGTCCAGACNAVDVLSFETYVQFGLDDEAYSSWQPHALRASAVAYRSYAAHRVLFPIDPGYDICSSHCCQAYETDWASTTADAVEQTGGIMLQKDSLIFLAEYSARNNSVWGPSCVNPDLSCGDGFVGSPALGWPCLQDPVAAGEACAGHGRGLSLWGTQDWALGHGWQWPQIVDHYYNASGSPSGLRAAFMTTPLRSVASNDGPDPVWPGSGLDVGLLLYNQAATGHDHLFLNARLVSQGGASVHDLSFAFPVAIAGQAVEAFSRTFQVPAGLAHGIYKLVSEVWLDVDQDGQLDAADLRLHVKASFDPVRVGDGGLPPYDAELLGLGLPASMAPGETRTVTVRAVNRGFEPWGRFYGNQGLAAGPSNGVLWSFGSSPCGGYMIDTHIDFTNGRVLMCETDIVVTDESIDFVFDITAPTDGSSAFQLEVRMVEDGTGFFGPIASWTIPVASSCHSSVPATSWRGQYFDNRTLSGSPVLTRDDGAGALDFEWGSTGPSPGCGLGTDDFSVRWTREITVADGLHRFTVTSDDGFRLFVDDLTTPVAEDWTEHPATTAVAEVPLAAGTHTVVLEYYEASGVALAQLEWELIPTIGTSDCFDWPMGESTAQGFVPGHGVRVTQNYRNRGGPTWYDNRYHAAADMTLRNQITAHAGVFAAANGVIRCAYNPQAGNAGYPGSVVVIEHTLTDGTVVYTQYGHLNPTAVTVGQSVDRGEQIGTLLPDSNIHGAHLHFEVRDWLYDPNGSGCLGPGYAHQIGDWTPEPQGWRDPIDWIFQHRPALPATVSNDLVMNVRDLPSTASTVINQLPAGSRVQAETISTDVDPSSKNWWYEIRYDGFHFGWVAGFQHLGWSGEIYLGEEGRACGSSGVQCTQGWDYWANPVDPADTYEGYAVCGLDDQTHVCTAAGWQGQGNSGCHVTPSMTQCFAGLDFRTTPIDPRLTFDGFEVCGGIDDDGDGTFDYGAIFECGGTGWNRLSGTDGCEAAMNACRCTGGLYHDGTPVDPDHTYCGMPVCGMDGRFYKCQSTGWVATDVTHSCQIP